MLAGASHDEIALVAFLLILVLLATKIGKIGEAIGGLFATRTPDVAEADEEDQEERQ
jgi:hypothetical protein